MKRLLTAGVLISAMTCAHAAGPSFNCWSNKNPEDIASCRLHEALPTRLTEPQAFARMVDMYGLTDAGHLGRGKLVWTGERPFPGCHVTNVPLWVFVWDGKQDKARDGSGWTDITITNWLDVTEEAPSCWGRTQ